MLKGGLTNELRYGCCSSIPRLMLAGKERRLLHLEKEHMKFTKVLFFVAGIYGLVALAPQYFLERKNGLDFPPAITHPEYYYGFLGVAIAWQLAFLILSRDPVRYRPFMPVAV